jgi:hypothetical protein
MCGFADYLTVALIRDDGFGNLFRKVYNQRPFFTRKEEMEEMDYRINNFPMVAPSRIEHPNGDGFIDFFNPTDMYKTKTNDCQDINFHFAINCKDDTLSTYKLRIFHIAIHSARSKKYEVAADGVETRNQKKYACGWYPNNGDGTSSGAFHYKIDNVKNRDGDSKTACDSNLPEDKSPFKKFIYDQQGNFQLMGDTEKFENLDNNRTCSETLATNPPEKKSKTKRYTVSQEFLNNEVNTLHRVICNLFIRFWNSNANIEGRRIVAPFFGTQTLPSDYTQTLPPYTGGNKNKLKRRKTKRRKTKRRKTKQRKTKRRKTKK